FYPALTDPTMLFQNNGAGRLDLATSFVGINDTALGKAVVVWNYDNDGDEDLLITNTFARPVIYRSDASTLARHWIQFKFRGTSSNRDGYGAVIRVTEAGRTQTALFNPSNGYIGQHESTVHFGLGVTDGVLDAIEVVWPSGIVQSLTAVAVNQRHLLTEPQVQRTAPVITTQPATPGVLFKNDPLILTVAATGHPAPVFLWEKDGVTIAGANQPTLRIPRIHPFDAGRYRVKVINPEGTVVSAAVDVIVAIDPAEHSVARWWNEFLLDAIRKDTPNPPVHARNLYHLSAAMWDAFWAYEEEAWTRALPVFHRENVAAADWSGGREAAQAQAISHAAFRVLTQRFKNSPGAVRSQFAFRWLMRELGYDPDFTGTTGNSPAAVGNRIGYAVLAATLNDGANEAGGYADATGYVSVNEPMIVGLPGATMANASRWQKLALRFSVAQNGIPLPESVQPFVGVNAIRTTPFALVKPTPTSIALDPGPPPEFGGATHAAFVQEALDCIVMSAALDPTDGVTVDISPGAYLNNPLGTNDGTGHALNPFTGQPYASNVVKRGDYARVLAEFWADGPASETPPGHWNVVHNHVTDDPRFVRRLGGTGPVLAPLEWDVRAYLAL
ncbi:MAG TPA: ASPIC/UnbV domain-containing protein, partial [Candidatus Synoicihabitans sp.]|nr:ASPIC/UnbV domain-containing protein [Candidatus Synoicihabitans sp.]